MIMHHCILRLVTFRVLSNLFTENSWNYMLTLFRRDGCSYRFLIGFQLFFLGLKILHLVQIADREDQLSAANRSIVNNFQADLEEKIRILCSTVSSFIARQKEQLESVEEICKSCIEFQDKVRVMPRCSCHKSYQ